MRKIFSVSWLLIVGILLSRGNQAAAQVGVGTTAPTARFHIAGQPFPTNNGEILRVDNMPDAQQGINNAVMVRMENGGVRQVRGTAPGQALIWNGDRWVLSNPSGVDVVGDAPITVTGGPFPFRVGLATGAGPGFWFYDGTTWNWVSDLTGAFTPEAPIFIDGTTIGLNPGNAIGDFYQWNGTSWELGGGGATTVWQVLRWDDVAQKWVPGRITGSCILNVGVSGNDLVVGFNAGNDQDGYLIYWNPIANCWQLGSFDTPYINNKITNFITNNFNTLLPTCTDAGHVLTWNGSAWICAPLPSTPGDLPTCADGEILVYNGTSNQWECRQLPSGGVLPTDCNEGEILVYNAATSAWECAPFTPTGNLEGTNPICVTPTSTGFSVGICPCADNQILRWRLTDPETGEGVWECLDYQPVVILDPTLAPRFPVEFYDMGDGNVEIGLTDNCPDGHTLVWNANLNGAGLGGWECAPATVNNYTITLPDGNLLAADPITIAVDPVAETATIGLRECAEGELLAFQSGAWTCVGLDNLALPVCGDNQILVYSDPDGDGTWEWVCADFPITLPTCDDGQILVYRDGTWACENTVTPPATPCANGQVLKYNTTTSAWECADDTDTGITTLSATSPLNATTVNNSANVAINNGTNNGDQIIWNSSTSMWEIRQPTVTAWQLTGNDANATDFIGTLNPVAFTVRSNNQERMRVNPNGQVQVNYNQNIVSTTGVSQGSDDVLQVLSASFPNSATFTNNAIHGRGGSKNSVGILGTNGNAAGTGIVGIGNGLPFYGIDGQPIFATGFVSQGAGVIGLGHYTGVKGLAMATSGGVESFGVYGESRSETDGAVGVFGDASSANAVISYGVVGVTSAENGGSTSIGDAIYAAGVLGQSYGSNAMNYGVIGETYSRIGNSAGLLGISDVDPSGPQYGVIGQTYSGYESAAGVYGDASVNNGLSYGVFGQTRSGSDGAAGVYGYGYNIMGVTYGVLGSSYSQTDGAAGVAGIMTGPGAAGSRSFAVKAQNLRPGAGINVGLMAHAAGGAENYAIWSNGNVWSSGTVGGSLKTFRIDHPLDPANKYLVHASIESNEAVNVYTGNVTTDANGLATVTLPDYVEAVNKDFRYQLTVIGRFANAIVKEKVAAGKFVIQTDQPNVEVSWSLTGVRNDKYMQAFPMSAEQDKGALRGKYIHPEFFGQPAESGVMYQPQPVMPEGGVDFKYTPARKVFKNRSEK